MLATRSVVRRGRMARCPVDLSAHPRRQFGSFAHRTWSAASLQKSSEENNNNNNKDKSDRKLLSTLPNVKVISSSPWSRRPLHSYRDDLVSRSLITSSSSQPFLEGDNRSIALQQALHNVILRAYFSTNTSTPSSTSSGSSSTATASDSSQQPDKDTTSTNIDSSATPTSSSSTSSSGVPSHKEERSIAARAVDAITSAVKAIVKFIFAIPGTTWFYLTNPSAFRERLLEIKEAAKKEAHHYWMGTKLLMADLRTAQQIMSRTMRGSPLTRRERKQLLRTVSDLFRLVPMSMFLIIPFMEFALPFALRLFPNMLPSTFQDSLKAEENMKRELQSRIAMAQFFQETLHDLAKDQKKQAQERRKKNDEDTTAIKKEKTAASFIEFLEKARKGEPIPAEVIVKFSSYFHDDLTLDNMPRMQLINMCKYMSIPPYGSENFLRFQLRNKIRTLKEDDQRILWEGIDSLTKMELREACQERGMRSTGLSKEGYKRALQQWLDLSVNQKVPVSLLIMSRTFFLREEMTSPTRLDVDGSKSVAGLADAISGLDKEVVNEVVLEVATPEEKSSDPDVLAIKLEVLEQQNELILEEQKEREAAAKKKEQLEKEKEEKEAADEAEAAEEATRTAEPVFSAATEPEIQVKSAPPVLVVEAEKPKVITVDAKKPTVIIVDAKKPTTETEVQEREEEEEEETELSSTELQAISQLVSPDPVSNEREQLERIKAAMLSDDADQQAEVEQQMEEVTAESEHAPKDVFEEQVAVEQKTAPIVEPMTSEEADQLAARTVAAMDELAEKESETTAIDSIDTEAPAVESPEGEEEYSYEDKRLDSAIKRLKARVESMVGKIEGQMSDVEVKIGDKLHLLDKDMDGILSKEEMAHALQDVLKRELTFEEAMDIACDMDENGDGILTVAELAHWLEEHKIEKLVEEGRDADVDRIVAEFENKEGDEEEQREEQTSSTTSSRN